MGEDHEGFDSPSMELASSRTAIALERTRLAIDRTLMAALRTALALIGFGFTIVKFFNDVGTHLGRADALAIPARNFGLSLVILGAGLLVAAIYNHWRSFLALDRRRNELHTKKLVRSGAVYRASPTGITAVLLLLTGLLVILGILARTGPFG